jgi:hypothetical protein
MRTKQMYSNNIKKSTFEDKFDRKYACWVRNNPKLWNWYKRQNRKQFRRIQKRWIQQNMDEE